MKATKAEVRKRVSEVLKLRLGGAEFHDIREYAAAPERAWGVSDSQLRRYVQAADRLCKDYFDAKADHLLARHVLQRRTLFARSRPATCAPPWPCSTARPSWRTCSRRPGSPRRTRKGRSPMPPPCPTPTVPPPLPPSAPRWALELQDRLLSNRPLPQDRLWAAPEAILTAAGLTPDPWQTALLRRPAARTLLLCSRQAGKSTVAAALALKAALLGHGSLVLLLSPTLRQSGELFRDKVLRLFLALGKAVPATRMTALTLELANGSRVVSLPGEEGTVRGYSGVALLVIDEAARVPDELYRAVRPMLAVSGGHLLALSTPFGKRGWFFEEWEGGGRWKRVLVPAHDCPRITGEFLREERAVLGERWYRQEYLCSFEDVVGAVFSAEEIEAMFGDPTVTPLPPLGAAEVAADIGPLYGMGEA
jgi:hypothetical protein